MFELAGHLGKTVGELEQTLGAWEYAEWRYQASEIPIGTSRDNLHAGIIASTISNMYLKKGSKPSMPQDFILVKAKDKIMTNISSAFSSLMALAKPKKAKLKKVKNGRFSKTSS